MNECKWCGCEECQCDNNLHSDYTDEESDSSYRDEDDE